MKLTDREQSVLEAIEYLISKSKEKDGGAFINNEELATELAKRGLRGYNNPQLGISSVSRFVSQLVDKGLIKIDKGDTTRDRKIFILIENLEK